MQRAVADGAVLRTGGKRGEGELAKGSYYLPTILDACDASMACVHDESFGPVLTVETFSGATREEAERQAAEEERLAAEAAAEEQARADEIAARAEAGRPVRCALIGAGKFGSMFLSQVPTTPGLEVAVIADLDPERARAACRQVGWDEARIARTEFVTSGADACGHDAVEVVVEGDEVGPARSVAAVLADPGAARAALTPARSIPATVGR